MNKLQIQLFNADLATPILQTDLSNRIENAHFGTKLPGGFNLFKFSIKGTLAESWRWITERVFYRIVIRDGEQILWEGRVQDIAPEAGTVAVTAYGYYSSMNDGKYSTAYDDLVSVVIKAILTAQCPQISSDQTNIDATNGSIDSAAGAEYLDKSPRELIEQMLPFADTDGHTWYFAIWDDRIPYLFERSTSTVDWFVRLADLKRFRLRHRASDLWNACYAVYEAGGAIARTATSTNANSVTKYGVTRTYAVPNLGAVAAAAAQAQRDTWLANHYEIYPSLEDIVLGDRVYDSNMKAYPSSWVRAGDVIQVIDLVPVSGDLDTVVRDALRTFYILETEYSIDKGESRISVDTEKKSLDAILAKEL